MSKSYFDWLLNCNIVLDEELRIAESMSLAVFLSLQQDQDHQDQLQQVLQSISIFYVIYIL